MKTRLALAIVAVLLPSLAVAQPNLSFTPTEVVVDGLEPSGGAALLSVSRFAAGWTPVIYPLALLVEDGDSDGTVSLDPEGGVADSSVWIVADLISGAVAIGAPEGTEISEVPFDVSTGLLPGESGLLDTVLAPQSSLRLLLMRPGVGAWTTAASDGGAEDLGDADDEAVMLSLAEATPLDPTTADAAAVQPGDVLAGVNPKTLECFVVALAE